MDRGFKTRDLLIYIIFYYLFLSYDANKGESETYTDKYYTSEYMQKYVI